MVLAFPGSSSFTGGFYKPEISVLASLLGGKSSIKWSPGFSLLGKTAEQTPGLHVDTHSAIYSDAGLLYVAINGPATAVKDAAFETVKIIKNIAEGKIGSEEFTKARASAKFKELEYGQELMAGLELTGSGLVHDGKPYQLDDSAKAIGEVTEEKLKEVSLFIVNIHRGTFRIANCVSTIGCQDSLGVQGVCFHRRRPFPAAIRCRHWPEGIDEVVESSKKDQSSERRKSVHIPSSKFRVASFVLLCCMQPVSNVLVRHLCVLCCVVNQNLELF